MHRLYENEDITVFWNSDKCRHAKRCVTGCPGVFDIQRKPWIDLSGAENAAIWQTIQKCPTGALKVTFNHGIEIVFEEEHNRSAAYVAETKQKIGECVYTESTEGWMIVHTETDPECQGKGIAKRLVYRVLEQAEKQKVKVIPVCSYAAKVLGE